MIWPRSLHFFKPALFIVITLCLCSRRTIGPDFSGSTRIFHQKLPDVPDSSTRRWADSTELRDFSNAERSSASPVGAAYLIFGPSFGLWRRQMPQSGQYGHHFRHHRSLLREAKAYAGLLLVDGYCGQEQFLPHSCDCAAFKFGAHKHIGLERMQDYVCGPVHEVVGAEVGVATDYYLSVFPFLAELEYQSLEQSRDVIALFPRPGLRMGRMSFPLRPSNSSEKFGNLRKM